jgi:hypothetical protein
VRIIHKKVPANFNYFLFGDNHAGSVLMDSSGLETFMHMVNSSFDGLPASRNYAWHSGDHIEARTVDHPYFQLPLTNETTPSRQVRACVKLFEPIKKQLIGMNVGNHPRALMNYGDFTWDACEALGIYYGTYSSKVVFTTTKGIVLLRAYHAHGKRAINSYAKSEQQRLDNMRLILKEHLKRKMSDCVLMTKGHTHKLLVCPPVSKLYITGDNKHEGRYTTDNVDHSAKYIDSDNVWFVNTGSFVKLYMDEPVDGIRIGPSGEQRHVEDMYVSGYAEEFEYDPLELGFAVARVREGKLLTVDECVLSNGTVRIRNHGTERTVKV